MSMISLFDLFQYFQQLQLLKKEVELLRNNVQKAEEATKAAKKKYDDECNKLNETSARFKAADDVRQEAYAKLQTLKKQLHEKVCSYFLSLSFPFEKQLHERYLLIRTEEIYSWIVLFSLLKLGTCLLIDKRFI